ncbi:MAG TPA: CopD family protein [Methylomirabilota bacterium]|nr:CopD family protein [Methylomirabilota bacterium]
MAGFLDVLLRGTILVLASLVLGGVVWTRVILRAGPGAALTPAARLALHVVAAAAAAAALAQASTVLVALVELGGPEGWPVAEFARTTFARAALVRVGLAVATALLAVRLSRRGAGPRAWHALGAAALGLVGASAVLSHAVARVDGRALLLLLDAAHQVAAAVWIGGLAHLVLYAGLRAREVRSVGAGAASTANHVGGLFQEVAGSDTRDHAPVQTIAGETPNAGGEMGVVRRFSSVAFVAVMTLSLAGGLLTWRYVGDWAGLVGTAYGVMVLSKVLLLAVILALAALNFRAVRRASAEGRLRLLRFAEVELGLGVTVLFAAASLTSLPPAVDVTADRATVGEVAARFRPAVPRLTSPPVAELIEKAEPLMAPVTRREPVERAWSEYNHHWAGFFVLAMGLLAALERLGVRAGRNWPLALLGLAAFLFLRNDPRAWPLGPAGFWESFLLPDVLQHRAFVVLILAFGVFEWMVRTGRLPVRPWGYVFPLLCAVGGGLLLTHSHAMFNLKDEFLTEVTHTPLGILGAFAGWGRWLELRLPGAGRGPGWLWTACLIAVGLILLVYREG